MYLCEQHGHSALHIAVETRCGSVVDRLVKAGAQLDVQSAGGETPLHAASRLQDRTIASRLLASGADPNIAMRDDGMLMDLLVHIYEYSNVYI